MKWFWGLGFLMSCHTDPHITCDSILLYSALESESEETPSTHFLLPLKPNCYPESRSFTKSSHTKHHDVKDPFQFTEGQVYV